MPRVAGTGIRVRIVQAESPRPKSGVLRTAPTIFTDYLDLDQVGAGWAATASRSSCGRRPRCRSFSPAIARGARRDRRKPCRKAPCCSRVRRVSSRNATHKEPSLRHIYNSLLVIDDKGEMLDDYDKIHLVPFGEYLPFQDTLESLGVMQLTGVPRRILRRHRSATTCRPRRATGQPADLLRNHLSRRCGRRARRGRAG